MSWGARKSDRVTFTHRISVYIMAIDGTWRRSCILLDASSTGARLAVEGTIEGLNLKEFFLLLSLTGLAFRRCELIRVNGDEIGIRYLEDKGSTKKLKPAVANVF
jgi:hypothetical protein